MLPKKNRADRKTVEKVFKSGNSLSSVNFSFRFSISPGLNTPKISIVVPKTLAKKAVDRNSLRRKGYFALEKYIKNFPKEIVGVIVFKKYQSNVSIIEDEIKKIISKIN